MPRQGNTPRLNPALFRRQAEPSSEPGLVVPCRQVQSSRREPHLASLTTPPLTHRSHPLRHAKPGPRYPAPPRPRRQPCTHRASSLPSATRSTTLQRAHPCRANPFDHPPPVARRRAGPILAWPNRKTPRTGTSSILAATTHHRCPEHAPPVRVDMPSPAPALRSSSGDDPRLACAQRPLSSDDSWLPLSSTRRIESARQPYPSPVPHRATPTCHHPPKHPAPPPADTPHQLVPSPISRHATPAPTPRQPHQRTCLPGASRAQPSQPWSTHHPCPPSCPSAPRPTTIRVDSCPCPGQPSRAEPTSHDNPTHAPARHADRHTTPGRLGPCRALAPLSGPTNRVTSDRTSPALPTCRLRAAIDSHPRTPQPFPTSLHHPSQAIVTHPSFSIRTVPVLTRRHTASDPGPAPSLHATCQPIPTLRDSPRPSPAPSGQLDDPPIS